MSEILVINDVGPRDGLQNQPEKLSVAERLTLINALGNAGVNNIEIGAFVSPKAVPQMAGSDLVSLELNHSGTRHYSALVPNLKGYQLAVAAGVRSVVMVVYGSEGMAQKNVRLGRIEANRQTEQMLALAKEDNVSVIATLAVGFHCPFDGPTDPDLVCQTAHQLLSAGAARFVVADTIGAANPRQVSNLMTRLVTEFSSEKLGCHFHDTRGLGLANAYAALDTGIRYFDASIAGLGGCPFAPGASGNVATEDMVMMMHSMGYDTGIDLQALLAVSDKAEALTGTAPGGRSKAWLQAHLAAGREL